MHLKNWSLLYPDRRTPVLSPAYITDRTVAAWERLPEKDLVSEKMRKAIGEQILTVAKSAGQVHGRSARKHSRS